MLPDDADTDRLLERARQRDAGAFEELLARHRHRLRQMVAVRMDNRISARVDPSDVVQEAMAEATKRFDAYVQEPVVAFYPWLRRIAWERLVDLHRRHIGAEKRSVTRERSLGLSDASTMRFAELLKARDDGPLKHMLRQELHGRVRAALAELDDNDREILVLRHLEQLNTHECAAVLGITENAAVQRHVRALRRFKRILADDITESHP